MKRKKFEEWLQEEHAKEYIGTDDNMVEAFQDWLQDLEPEDWLQYGERYAINSIINTVSKLQDEMFAEKK